MIEKYIQIGLGYMIQYATENLMAAMLVIFALGIFARWTLYYTQSLASNFVREFEKRLYSRLNEETEIKDVSFFRLVKYLLEQTYFEFFELRARFRRRKRIDDNDNLKIIRDRVLLVQDGCALLVKDTLKQVRYLKVRRAAPSTLDISKTAFDNNQAFSKFFGFFNAQPVNSIVETLPGMFIVFGIFGTFLGIMQALPELRGMDITDTDQTKLVMDAFLLKVSFAMSSSILGIMLSVMMTFFNNMFDPASVYVSSVERFSACLKVAWNRSIANKADDDITPVEDTIPATEREEEAAEILNQYLENRKLISWREGKEQPKVYQPDMENAVDEVAEPELLEDEELTDLPNTSMHRMDSIDEVADDEVIYKEDYAGTDPESSETYEYQEADKLPESEEIPVDGDDLTATIETDTESKGASVQELPNSNRPKRPKKKRSA